MYGFGSRIWYEEVEVDSVGEFTRVCHVCVFQSMVLGIYALQWRLHGRYSVSNHQPHHSVLNRFFRRRSKKTSKLRVTGLCAGNSPVTGEFPTQMASNAKNVSIWWRHHDNNFKSVIERVARQKHVLRVTFLSISYEIALRWMLQVAFDYKSTLVQTKTRYRQEASHHLFQWRPRSMWPNSVTISQWVNVRHQLSDLVKRDIIGYNWALTKHNKS